MELFIDTADLEEIRQAKETGLLNGVTTNPTLIAKALASLREKGKRKTEKEHLLDIFGIVGDLPVSVEVVGFTPEEASNYKSVVITADRLIREGEEKWQTYSGNGRKPVIKIPVCPAYGPEQSAVFDAGLKAIARLSEQRIPINTTLIFSPEQALAASWAGAEYVSPFVGRVDDKLAEMAGMKKKKEEYFPREGVKDSKGETVHMDGIVSGTDLVGKIVRIFENYAADARILAASLRNTRQVSEMMEVGADIATLPYEVFQRVVQGRPVHELTFKGMQGFSKDAADAYLAMRAPSDPKQK